jgi:uncharacterized membrane protein
MSLRTEPASRSEQVIQSFLTGVIGILPLGLTVIVLAWIVSLLHDLAGPASLCGQVFRSVGMSVVACDVTAYLIGLTGAFLLVYVVGLMIERGIGRRWSRTMDGVLDRIPVLGTVYDASKQVTSVFDRKQDSKQSMSPVICYLGENRAAWTPALMPTTDCVRRDGVDYHVVMIPTAPVPFGGALLCVRADWVEPANCGIEELIGIYMSMGVTAPRSLGRGEPEPPEHHAGRSGGG